MKRISLVLLMASLIVVITTFGCDDQPESVPLENITLNRLDNISCGSSAEFCGYLVKTTLTVDVSGTFMYQATLEKGQILRYSEPVILNITGPGTRNVDFLFPYWNALDTGDYFLDVTVFPMSASPGQTTKRVTVTTSDIIVNIGSFYSADCWKNCCTDKNYDENRWHALGAMTGLQPDITGVKCWMGVYVDVTMCGDNIGETQLSQSWGTISVGKTNKTIWGQCGIAIQRTASGIDQSFVFFEVEPYNPADLQQKREFPSLSTGDSAFFTMELDHTTGVWTYQFSSSDTTIIWSSDADTSWQYTAGDEIDFAGEILHRETDMMGTDNNRLWFREIQYRRNGNWYDADINYLQIDDKDDVEWKADTSNLVPNEVYVWDVRPLP